MKVRTHLRSGWWYTVQPGDSLYSIAQKQYGNGDRWIDIYNHRFNSYIIGPNPNYMQAGIWIELW